MDRTGHSTTSGVRAYKRVSEKLREVTSDVLNGVETTTCKRVRESSLNPEPVTEKPPLNPVPVIEAPRSSSVPVINFSGAYNFHINFNYGSK